MQLFIFLRYSLRGQVRRVLHHLLLLPHASPARTTKLSAIEAVVSAAADPAVLHNLHHRLGRLV